MKKRKSVRKNSVRKINPQKVFCFISFIFILTCCLWYGGRLVYFYCQEHKGNEKVVETDSFANKLVKDNSSNKSFRKYDDEYYFYQGSDNNYLIYSNILWRIVKINKDNSILLISDDAITSLAYGTDEVKYGEDVILKWLNKDANNSYSGVLESKLNHISDYLVKTSVCTDVVDDVNKISCEDVNKDYYLGLLTVEDYIKTGAKKSFIHGKSVSYLANMNKDKQIWYLGEDGSLNQSSGDDILGIRPTITLIPSISIKSGTGTLKDPYKIEDKSEYFGSYVKLDEDMWRVYDVNDENVKLVLMDYAKDVSNANLEYKYSNNTYRHNDTINGSLAYYLNHTYLNSLSYKSIILDGYYYNGYYGADNDYQLKELYEGQIDTKVGLLSIGDVMFNHSATNYFTSTGIAKGSNSVYVMKANGEAGTRKVTASASVVPCITIKKDNLKVGSGSENDPYRMR